MFSKKMKVPFALALFASALIPVFSNAADIAAEAPKKVSQIKVIKAVNPLPVTRLYLVKNENGYPNALTEAELDAPAKITRLGNARKVSYGGHMVEVETTIVMQGTHVSTISSATMQGDTDDE